MRDAARKAARLAGGHGREDLEAEDTPLADALVRLISVIGEAGNKVSPGTRSRLDGIPWPDVIGMRNRLVHDYFDILWATVQDSLPSLIQWLESALAEDEEGRQVSPNPKLFADAMLGALARRLRMLDLDVAHKPAL
jgi:uncharacterized protein with HEPN domain